MRALEWLVSNGPGLLEWLGSHAVTLLAGLAIGLRTSLNEIVADTYRRWRAKHDKHRELLQGLHRRMQTYAGDYACAIAESRARELGMNTAWMKDAKDRQVETQKFLLDRTAEFPRGIREKVESLRVATRLPHFDRMTDNELADQTDGVRDAVQGVQLQLEKFNY
jgi:hypothetical protein